MSKGECFNILVGLLFASALHGCAHQRGLARGEPVTTTAVVQRRECFLLFEIGVGQVRRAPSEGCASRVPPMSTFKVAHALAALDAGVLKGPDEIIQYDGSPWEFESFRQDHTL